METTKQQREMRSTLARMIHDARMACGLTQEQLALHLGLKARAVSR